MPIEFRSNAFYTIKNSLSSAIQCPRAFVQLLIIGRELNSEVHGHTHTHTQEHIQETENQSQPASSFPPSSENGYRQRGSLTRTHNTKSASFAVQSRTIAYLSALTTPPKPLHRNR